MKKLSVFCLFLYLLYPVLLFSEDEPTICPMDMSRFSQDTIPNYLKPWWNTARVGKFAVLYVDFPDGRYINGSDTLQPFTDSELEWVYTHGEIDAAGEMGLILEQTNIPAGNKYVKASKYSWYDRWNMFFDSAGVYYGTAHPDWASNGDSAWGSMKQYWKEASNGKFDLIPYTTHPNESDYKLRTGIVNDYQMVNGVPVIKCIMLKKKKYGSSDANSYFRNYNDYNSSTAVMMTEDAITAINNYTDFDLQQFLNEKGILFVYFAGSHRAFKDETNHNQISPIRLRENSIIDPESRIDGFGVSAHQYGHLQFGWKHTNSGRCDIMNGGDVHDNNSPQFPNPVYRMLQGWLQPVAMDSVQQEIELPPVETTYKCGVVTIYGKPSAAPDYSTGESFIVENRRRLGFDKKIIDEYTSSQFPNFKGGLLVWHYSPYYGLEGLLTDDSEIKFLSADTNSNLYGNRGNPKSFFAYDEFATFQFKNLDSSRTFSGTLLSVNKLPTGMELRNIEQVDYSNLQSNVLVDLKYLIRPPRKYTEVIYFRDYNNRKISLHDTVYYHNYDPGGFFEINSGTVIETPGHNAVQKILTFNGLESRATTAAPIIFKGIGYTPVILPFHKIRFPELASFQSVDSLILSNIKIQNSSTFTEYIELGSFFGSINPIPIILEDIELPINSNEKELRIFNSTISKINLSNISIEFLKEIKFYNKVSLDNSHLIFNISQASFENADSYLRIKNNSSVTFSDTLALKFKTGSNLIADGVVFKSLNSTQKWNGIKLENTSNDTIINSTFRNAKVALSFVNTNGSYNSRVIKNDSFFIPSGGDHKGIYGENNYNILIQDNVFNMPVTTQSGSPFYSGIFLKNSSTSSEPENAGNVGEEQNTSTPYSLNIIHNTFNYGSGSAILANYTSNVLPYYIKSNNFNSASVLGLLGMKITGTIRDNVSSNFITPLGIHLVNSSPNLYNNTIVSKDVSLHLIGKSYPNLSPYINGNQLIWTGGKNRFTTQRYDNIQLVHPANVYTDFGENRFNILDTTLASYHIYGWLDTAISTYYGRNNCWYPDNTAKIYLRHTLSGPPVPTVTTVTTIDCDREIDPNGWIVENYGNSVLDSIMISENNTGETSSAADMIYEQAFYYMDYSLYLDAVSSFKNLIDNYEEYENLPKSAQHLYSCYEYLDTSFSQNERNVLFGNLKIYTEAKINSDDYKNEEFLDVCFDIVTMCEANMENYDAASNNYEFIALYHPDPDIRLNASWNYAEVQALINSGNGGGNQFQITNDKLQINQLVELRKLEEIRRINEVISNDPLMRKMKKSYEKVNTGRKEKIVKQIQSENKLQEEIQSHIRISDELDKSKEDKARKNLFELKYLSNEDLEKRRVEDLILTTKNFKNESDGNERISIPVEYRLSQNYPNPFNPATTISFEIPKSGFVKLIIYDMLGREMSVLVNEFKEAGAYETEFNGANISSGIYFYKIESGDFVQVKRMVLLK